MVSKSNVMGLMAVLAGMMIFKGTSHMPKVEAFIQDKPLIIIGLGFALFFYRGKIAERFGKNGKN